MDPSSVAAIADDERQVRDIKTRLLIWAKLIWYAVSRPFMHARIKAILRPLLRDDSVFGQVDMFLNGDGGMFKTDVYRNLAILRPLKGASVMVPGAGYGRNLWQLAYFRPKEILAFDLFDYPQEWEKVSGDILAAFGVPVTFLKGGFDVIPKEREGSFDFIISDAVLEHVPDMSEFASGSARFLKQGGIFYASFGPLWYGPSGDHVTWGEEKLFDHLLLPEESYKKQLSERSLAVLEKDSCDPGFMIQENFFSYQKSDEYLNYLRGVGFEIMNLRSKTSMPAIRLLKARPDLAAALDAKSCPAFDRFSAGLYVWARKKSIQG